MKRALFIFYAIALAIHAAILFWLKPPAPKPPKILNETYVEVALTAPPSPQLEPPKPSPSVIQPLMAPKPEEKPPPPPEPKPEMTIPEPKPVPPPPVVQPVIVPPLQTKPPSTDYVPVTQPTFALQAPHKYPPEAARRRQQGVVVLLLYINGSGTLDRLEIVKSSGYPLLDEGAIREMKSSRFQPALDGAIPIRSRAEVTVTFRLE